MNTSVGRTRHEPLATRISTQASRCSPLMTPLLPRTVPTATRAGTPSRLARRAIVAAYCSSLPTMAGALMKPSSRRTESWPASNFVSQPKAPSL